MGYWLDREFILFHITGLYWIAQKGETAAVLEEKSDAYLKKVSDWLTPEEARQEIETRYGY